MNKIVEFQKDHNLVADGIIGRNTINKFKSIYKLNNYEVAHFLGQTHHETLGFTKDTESLNYSATGLINTFSYYRKNKAEAYIDGRTALRKANQKSIANKVYADKNRSTSYKLGNIKPNDGYNFIGRGSIHLTGYNNYLDFAKWKGDYLVIFKPELLSTFYFWDCGLFFFSKNNLWNFCTGVEEKHVDNVTKRINYATDSYKERFELVKYYYSLT